MLIEHRLSMMSEEKRIRDAEHLRARIEQRLKDAWIVTIEHELKEWAPEVIEGARRRGSPVLTEPAPGQL